jgi:DNA polymerase-1
MIKLAMIAVHKSIKKEGLQTKMILQVHDELVFDVPRNEIDIVRPIIIREMENAMVLPNGVPIKAESGVGDNWLEAH